MEFLNNSKLLNKYLKSDSYKEYFNDDLIPCIKLARFDENENIPIDKYLYLMMSGRASVKTYLANGKEIITSTLKGPCLIGEIEIIRKQDPLTVRSLEECYVLTIPLDKCLNYLLNDAHFLYALCKNMADKERKQTLSVIHAYGYPLENRLALFILENRQGNNFYIKKVQISQSLGASYRHVEKVMNDFVCKKYLIKEKLVYKISNEKALHKLANELNILD